jgi:diadenosine tetraphosphate (Ap4A) HIT family hydrolase
MQNSTFVVKYDRYPVADGHVLIIPKRHVLAFTELKKSEVFGFYELLREAQKYLLLKFSPDGFTIGINQGKAAGQTIEHLHIHLIPRHLGDVDSPEGGIRKIVPNKVLYPPVDL